MKKILILILCIAILMSALPISAFALESEKNIHFESILGVYEGIYTAPQGVTGLLLSIYRTQDLLNDNILLEKYVNVANKCSESIDETEQKFTVEKLKSIISEHLDDYIALFNFYSTSSNPNVEEGLYTMTISYNETNEKFEFKGSQWIQRKSYGMADLKNIVLTDDTLTGDVFGEYNSFLLTEYGDVGDVSVSSGKSCAGYRIDFENKSASLDVNEKVEIKVVVKNDLGVKVSDKQNIRWFSSDENIATITGENWGDSNFDYAIGKISGISEGITEVYAELDNNRIAKCKVIVSKSGLVFPLEITTTYELISNNPSLSDGEITKYFRASHYKIIATIKNADIKNVTNVKIELNLPDSAKIYGEYELQNSVSQILAGESTSYIWEILAESSENDTKSIQYYISAESDQTVKINEFKTIFVKPFVDQDNRIDPRKDVWNFTNNDYNFNKGYFINQEYYQPLVNSVSNIEKENIDNYINSEWHGSCFGMSTIVALMKIGQLNLKDYDESAKNVNDLSSPKNNEDIYSLITYYHMLQKLDTYLSNINNNAKLSESERLKQLVNSIDQVKIGKPPVMLLIDYMIKDYDIHSIKNDYFDGSGHALIAYDIEYSDHYVNSIVGNTKIKYDKKISVYDPNNKKTIYLHINKDFTKWILDGYCQNQTKDDGLFWYKGEGRLLFLNDFDVFESNNINDSKTNYSAKLVANMNTKLRILLHKIDGTIEELIFQGLNLQGGDNTSITSFINNVSGKGGTSFGYLFNDDIKSLTILPEDENSEVDLAYTFNNVSYEVESERGKVSISKDRVLSLENDGIYSVTAIYNKGEYSSDWYYYRVEGDSKGTISLSQNEQGYTIISGDDLNNIKLMVKNKYDSDATVFSTKEKSVMISNRDDSIVLLLDTNEDGIYETELDLSGGYNNTKGIAFVVLVVMVAGICCAISYIVIKRKRLTRKS